MSRLENWSPFVKSVIAAAHVFSKNSGLPEVSPKMVMVFAIEMFPSELLRLRLFDNEHDMRLCQLKLLRGALCGRVVKPNDYLSDELVKILEHSVVSGLITWDVFLTKLKEEI